MKRPERPSHIPDYAETCLLALVAEGLSDRISLGGAFGLLHYLDYRSTHDVDAWWNPQTTRQEKDHVTQVIKTALSSYGEIQTRTWGDVISIELLQTGKTVFTFQIAQRTVQLEPPVNARWIDVPLDSLSDLIASKMVALVERGAPRDFRDIFILCQSGLTSPERCWQLWRQRQLIATSNTDAQRARLAIDTHLSRIELHRPLESIVNQEQKTQAGQVRTWFREEFVSAILD